MKLIYTNIKPEKLYIFLAIFFGFLFIFVVPPFYVQDEVHHFYRAYQIADGQFIGEKRWRNLYLLSVKSIGKDGVYPVKWTEPRPILVKDQHNDIYIYAIKNAKWKYTKLDKKIFADIQFPPLNADPILLNEDAKNPAIFIELKNKQVMYDMALYQAGGFLPKSIVDTTHDLMHHLPVYPYQDINKLKIQYIYNLLFQELQPAIKQFIDFNNTVLYAPIAYLPQVIAIVIGKLLYFSPVMLLYFARILTCVCSLTLIYYAIKITPILKWNMCLLALMPLSFWEVASASYDNLIISFSFLLTAIFLHYALQKDKINISDIIVIGVLSSIVAVAKVAYFPLIFLYFLIPKNKIGSLSKYLFIFGILCFLNLLLLSGWNMLVKDIYVPYVYDGNIDPYAQLLHVLQHPIHFLNVLLQYFSNIKLAYFEYFVGMIGFLNTPQLLFIDLYFVALILVPFLSDQNEPKLNIKQKVLIGSVFMMNFIIVFLLIYLSSTVVGAIKIYGMRQRYLIPFVILFFSLLQSKIFSRYEDNVTYYKVRLLSIITFTILWITVFAIINECYDVSPLIESLHS